MVEADICPIEAKDWLCLGIFQRVPLLTKAIEKELDNETNVLAIFRRGWVDGSRQSKRFYSL